MTACKYITDGTDTDGTVWHRCLTHDELAPSADGACAGNDESPALVADLWTWDDDYRRAWAPTTDPRVLAVGRRGDDESDELAERSTTARSSCVNWHYSHPGHRQLDYERMLARWLRIFHDATAETVDSTVHQGYSALILNTPSWREHVGATEPTTWRVTSVTAPGQGFRETTHDVETAEAAAVAHVREVAGGEDATRRITSAERVSILAGDVETWQAYLDGEVFGIGYAILDDDDEDGGVALDLTHVVTMTSWGYYGETYAMEEAHADALDLAADELKARAEREAQTVRELTELALREREAAVDRADLAAGLKALDALIPMLAGHARTELAAFRLDRWPAAARFVAAHLDTTEA